MFVIRRELCAVALCVLATIGCDKKKDAASAPAAGGLPPLDQPKAAAGKPSDRPVHEPAASGEAANLPPGHPPIMPSGSGENPHGMGAGAPSGGFQGTTPGGDFDASTVVAGVIKLDGKMKDKVADGDTIFVVARRYEEGSTAPGTALAVKKLTAG